MQAFMYQQVTVMYQQVATEPLGVTLGMICCAPSLLKLLQPPQANTTKQCLKPRENVAGNTFLSVKKGLHKTAFLYLNCHIVDCVHKELMLGMKNPRTHLTTQKQV